MTDTAPQSAAELLAAMVRIPSINSEAGGDPRAEAALGDYLESVAAGWGIEARRLPVAGRADNLLLLHRSKDAPANDARPWLLFDSHMDTVAVEGMTVEPFGAKVEGGRLFGRGACDTKGTGAAALWALREYAQQEEQPNHVAVLFSVDEEAKMAGIRSFIANDLPRLRAEGIAFRGAIVGEPTLHRPVIAHNGLIRWHLTTIGKAAHSAAPYLGRSAISMMARIITTLESDYIAKLATKHPLTGPAVCSITMIEGGTQINILPERCTIAIDRRLTPGERPEDVLPAVAQVLAPLVVADPKLRFEQSAPHTAPPLNEKTSTALQAVVQEVLHECGFDDPPIGAPFATHAGDLCQAGLPAIVLGPGDPTPAHTKDEWVALDEIRTGARVYRSLMQAKL